MKKVRFYINRDLDKFMAEQFLDEEGGGVDFGANIVKTHPALKIAKENRDKRKTVIKKYFDKYYLSHRREMIEKINVIKKGWRDVEQEYARVTENVFGGSPFPAGKYIAYVSIVNCNPRFLESKTFQIFYEKNRADAIYTIAHELLHFIFFDFIKKKLKREVKKLSPDKLWDLSEIFNVVVLHSPVYRHIINQRYAKPYPAHRKYLQAFKSAYAASKNIESFIRRGVRLLNHRK